MSLPGGWREDSSPSLAATTPTKVPKKRPPRQSNQHPDYTNPAVTQFINENFKELKDLENVDKVIATLRIEQDDLAAKVRPLAPTILMQDYRLGESDECSETGYPR
jgi:hypothetical protein